MPIILAIYRFVFEEEKSDEKYFLQEKMNRDLDCVVIFHRFVNIFRLKDYGFTNRRQSSRNIRDGSKWK